MGNAKENPPRRGDLSPCPRVEFDHSGNAIRTTVLSLARPKPSSQRSFPDPSSGVIFDPRIIFVRDRLPGGAILKFTTMCAPSPSDPSPPTPAQDDHALLRTFIAGHQDAFAILLRRHERMVFSAALRILGDPGAAQDAAQQTFLLLARHVARVRPPVVIAGWLYHTARHQAETLSRSMQRRKHRERLAADAAHPTATSLVPGWDELSSQIDAALAKLPTRLREAVVLCLLENQDRDLAATQLGCSPDALTNRLARALDQLRTHLSRPGRPVAAAALALLITQHGSEAHAAGLAPSVLAAHLVPEPAASLTWAASLKLTTIALLVVGAFFVSRTTGSSPSTNVAASSFEPAVSSPQKPAAPPATIPPSPPSTAAPNPAPIAELALAYIPETNPYKPALIAYAKLTQASINAEKNGAPPPTPEERSAALAAITRSLAAGSAAPAVDWGVDYSLGFQTLVTHVTPAQALAKALFKEMPDTASPSERLARSLDILALGHHLGRDGAAIEVLIGNSVAKGALDQLDPLITKLSPKDSALLAVELRKLPPLGTLSTALAYEKNFFIDNLTHELTKELARALAQLSPTDSASPHSTLDAALSSRLADFQMLGLIKEGPVTRVGLSSPIGNFWLTPGETRQGLTLLSVTVTPDRANALLMVEKRPVVLNLAKGTFGIPAMEVLEAAARALSSPSLTGMLLKARPAGTMADLFSELETSVRQISALITKP